MKATHLRSLLYEEAIVDIGPDFKLDTDDQPQLVPIGPGYYRSISQKGEYQGQPAICVVAPRDPEIDIPQDLVNMGAIFDNYNDCAKNKDIIEFPPIYTYGETENATYLVKGDVEKTHGVMAVPATEEELVCAYWETRNLLILAKALFSFEIDLDMPHEAFFAERIGHWFRFAGRFETIKKLSDAEIIRRHTLNYLATSLIQHCNMLKPLEVGFNLWSPNSIKKINGRLYTDARLQLLPHGYQVAAYLWDQLIHNALELDHRECYARMAKSLDLFVAGAPAELELANSSMAYNWRLHLIHVFKERLLGTLLVDIERQPYIGAPTEQQERWLKTIARLISEPRDLSNIFYSRV